MAKDYMEQWDGGSYIAGERGSEALPADRTAKLIWAREQMREELFQLPFGIGRNGVRRTAN